MYLFTCMRQENKLQPNKHELPEDRTSVAAKQTAAAQGVIAVRRSGRKTHVLSAANDASSEIMASAQPKPFCQPADRALSPDRQSAEV